MEVILFPAAFAAMVVALFIKSKYYPLFIAMGYTIFGAAAVHCLFDIVRRLDANDIGNRRYLSDNERGVSFTSDFH